MVNELALIALGLTPFLCRNKKQLTYFSGVVILILLFLQPSAYYGRVIGYQEATKWIYLTLPPALLFFVSMTAARADPEDTPRV